MKLVQHPNVVRLYEVIDTPNKLYLILELADGGDMYDYIMKYANGLSEILSRRYFRQICRALKYCHEMHVCHRDLKVRLKIKRMFRRDFLFSRKIWSFLKNKVW
jgi:serine/threonine protein kinase